MRYAGIDIASQTHVVAVVDDSGQVETKPSPIGENAEGYAALIGVLGQPAGVHVVMEATGHYWQNMFAHLEAQGYAVTVVNPVRTRRYAEEDLRRTKTDSIDALGLARFGAEKKPQPTRLPDSSTLELREMVRMRDRFVQDLADRMRRLHRLVDLGFPELKRHLGEMDGELALALLTEYPTAASYSQTTPARIARLKYGTLKIGRELAQALFDDARKSVGQHQGRPYQLQIGYTCDDIRLLKKRIRDIEGDIENLLNDSEVGKLLTTIPGIGPQTAARVMAEIGDPAQFTSANTLAAYVGVIPGLRQSGKNQSMRGRLTPYGHARLRKGLWMPTMVAATCHNPWLKQHYKRLRARGKPAKVALIACMRKLLAAIFSVAKNRRPFIPILAQTKEAAR